MVLPPANVQYYKVEKANTPCRGCLLFLDSFNHTMTMREVTRALYGENRGNFVGKRGKID